MTAAASKHRGSIALRGLEKTYPDGTRAVRGVDLTITPGELIVLLGPSGCGKTTTLRMIAGLEKPTAGRIELDGADITYHPPAARDVGFVFQFYALYPHLRVRDNVAFPLEAIGVPAAERRHRVRQVSERVGIDRLLERFPAELSGGDRQRVSLARAMVRRPAIWLMDEPLGTLDSDRRLEMREFIREQQLDMQITTVYVTHDQEEAMSLADRVVVMADGRIQQVGPPDEVYDRPINRFVARFVGSPGMNFIEGVLHKSSDEMTFRAAELELRLPMDGACPQGEVTLGVRPEYVRERPDGPIVGVVTIDEYLGTHHNLHLDTPLGPLIARGAHARSMGEKLRVGFDLQHIRTFGRSPGESDA